MSDVCWVCLERGLHRVSKDKKNGDTFFSVSLSLSYSAIVLLHIRCAKEKCIKYETNAVRT